MPAADDGGHALLAQLCSSLRPGTMHELWEDFLQSEKLLTW